NPKVSIFFGGGFKVNMQSYKWRIVTEGGDVVDTASRSETDPGLILGGGFIFNNVVEFSLSFKHIFTEGNGAQYIGFGLKYHLSL
ncbi:MAG: hypothetical protein ABDH49_08715, partial [Candidatus Hydrothermales bacterium]